MADGTPSTRRIELVDTGAPRRAGMPGYIGVGLLAGVVVGLGPLRDAALGNGPFEAAMIRFAARLLVCLVAANLLGRLLDGASRGRGREAGREDHARTEVDQDAPAGPADAGTR